MAKCSVDYPYLGDTMRYLQLCSIYPVHTVYIGEYPYHPRMLPRYPAAFSHNHRHGTPRTLTELCRYYRGLDADMVMEMMAHSWTLLPMGIAMINADYMSGGTGIGEEYRGVRYIGRIDQMSHFISGAVLNMLHPSTKINLIGIGKTGRTVAREVKSRIRTLNCQVTVHEVLQPVSGSIRGVSDGDIMDGSYTIFHSRGSKEQILRDARWVCESSKVCDLQIIADSYDTTLAGSSTMASSNAEVISSVGVALSNMMSKLESREGGCEKESPATVGEVCGLVRCVAAIVRVMKDGGGSGGGAGRGVGGTGRPSVSSPIQQYTTSMSAVTQRSGYSVGAGTKGTSSLSTVPERGAGGKGGNTVGTTAPAIGGRRRRKVVVTVPPPPPPSESDIIGSPTPSGDTVHTVISGTGSAGADTVTSGDNEKCSPQSETEGKGTMIPIVATDDAVPVIGTPTMMETVCGSAENGGGEGEERTVSTPPVLEGCRGAGETGSVSETTETGGIGSEERSVEPSPSGPVVNTPVSGTQRRRRSSGTKNSEVRRVVDSGTVDGDNKGM